MQLQQSSAGGSSSSAWSSLLSATANLTLNNAGYSTTFNNTLGIAYLFANTTAATSSTTNASPSLELAANYWTGSASAQDLWTISSGLGAGTNGVSLLTINHSGSTQAEFEISGISNGLSIAMGGGAALNLTNLLMKLSDSTNCYAYISRGYILGPSSSVIGWTNSSNAGGTQDTSFSRLAANSIGVGNGNQGDVSGNITAKTYTVATSAGAPTSAGTAGTAGQIIYYSGLLYFCSVTGAAGSATWNKLNMTAV